MTTTSASAAGRPSDIVTAPSTEPGATSGTRSADVPPEGTAAQRAPAATRPRASHAAVQGPSSDGTTSMDAPTGTPESAKRPPAPVTTCARAA